MIRKLETAEELLLALERGEARGVSAPPPGPLWHRGALARWQAVALVSVVIDVLLLYLLLAS